MCWYTTSSSRPWNRSTNGTGPSTPVTSTAPSSSTIGSRRRAAAIASPSRVCAFSRTSSSSRAACQVARSTTGGLPGRLLLALPGVVVIVSSAVSSRALAGSLGGLSVETTHGAETHRSECQVTFRDTGRAHEQQPVGVLVDLGHHTMRKRLNDVKRPGKELHPPHLESPLLVAPEPRVGRGVDGYPVALVNRRSKPLHLLRAKEVHLFPLALRGQAHADERR